MIKQVIAGLLVSSNVCFAQTAAPTTTSFVDNISICDTLTLVNYKAGEQPNSDTTLFQFVQGVNYKINDSFTASLEIFYDESDQATAAILAAAVGNSAAVSVSFYYEGTAAGVDKYLTGNGLISGISWNGEANGVFTASVSITGTGTLTEATAS